MLKFSLPSEIEDSTKSNAFATVIFVKLFFQKSLRLCVKIKQ
ncbi:hypothetical protein QF004_002830 [Chryseobacterium sp. MDT2-18]|nr:hypothetical protein [Chryseobacterium sp. MDT2-18]